MLTPWKNSYDQPRQHDSYDNLGIKNQRHYFANKGPSSQVWMWELGYKVSWMPKNWCFWIMVFKETLEGPLDREEIQPVHHKGNQSWIFIGRTDAKAEAQYFGHLMWRTESLEEYLDAGKDWRKEKGTTENEMVGWHHRLNGHAFERTLGVGNRQGSLACCNPWGCKESDKTEQLNWTD